MAADLDAHIWGVMAASGTGKGLWLKSQLKRMTPRRLIVWDFKREYGEFAKPCSSLEAMHKAMVKAGDSGPLCLAYHPQAVTDKGMQTEFQTVCSLVYAWESCTFIAEELSMVTTPSWAPPAWRRMSTSGRHQGVHLIGVAQMPALIDKAFLGNCTLIHCGPLHEERHRNGVERSMDIEAGSLADLRKFQWVEKDRDTGEITTGTIVPKGIPAPPTPSVPKRRGRGRADAGQARPGALTIGPSQPNPSPRRATK